MATPTIVVLVVGMLATVLLVGFVVLVQVQRVTRAYREASGVIERMQPALTTLADQQQVTSREVQRVGDAMDALRADREARRRDRA